MNKVNWGIIGCGDVTEVKSGPAFNKVSSSRLVAAMRRDEEKARHYAKRHGVPKWYKNAYDLIADPEVDAIYVATPPSTHEEYTIAALQAGKPVYVEKPMSTSASSAARMQEAAAKANVKLSVAHYRRELPFFKQIKGIIDAGELGDIRLVNLQLFQSAEVNGGGKPEANWRIDPEVSGGGLFHDLAPHQLDLMLYFFGNIKEAKGFGLNQANLYQADDIVSGEILFENKVLLTGSWCFTVPKEETRDLCEIIGSKGKIVFPVFGHHYIKVIGGKQERVDFERPQHIQQAMIEQVVRFFRDEAPNPCPAAAGVEVMRIMETFTRRL